MSRSVDGQSVVHDDLELVVRDLGRMAYRDALVEQRRLQQEVIASRGSQPSRGHLLLVEHDPPVITVSRRRGARDHLLASATQLAEAGVEVCDTDRGGDITYHGPGQLVVYPILDLNVLGLRLHGYMRLLEQVAIDVIARYGLRGHRDPSATGVWVDEPESGQRGGPSARRKICAMGVRVSRWVTMHGLALNVHSDLRHFELIVPCGLDGRGVTSLEDHLGAACPDMDNVKRALVDVFRDAIGRG